MKLYKWNMSRFWRHLKPRRKYKDKLFQRIFSDKKDLLDLYNAVNQTSYTNPDDLEITTLEDVIYLSMKNDLSFIISSTLNLYEHQSTFNPNMPIRGLIYFARLYETYIKKHSLDVYGRQRISLPAPQFVVFYNGRENQPDELILKLSDCFTPNMAGKHLFPVLECQARMVNINYGHNQKLLDSCKRLHDYSYFVAEVNKNLDSGYDLSNAVYYAMNVCIKKDVLSDILEKSKSEVFHMILTEYNEKLHLKTVYNEGHEDGTNEARMEAIRKTITMLRKLNTPEETIFQLISEEYNMSVEEIKNISNQS